MPVFKRKRALDTAQRVNARLWETIWYLEQTVVNFDSGATLLERENNNLRERLRLKEGEASRLRQTVFDQAERINELERENHDLDSQLSECEAVLDRSMELDDDIDLGIPSL
jgi:chromosome segregation ATPase